MLCPRCERINVWLLITSGKDFVQHADDQPDYFWHETFVTNDDAVLCYKHSDNFLGVESSAPSCKLCAIIRDALVPHNPDPFTCGLPVILYGTTEIQYNGTAIAQIIVALDGHEGPAELCALDISKEHSELFFELVFVV